MASHLSADDLHELRQRGAQPAGPPPAPPAPPRLGLLPAEQRAGLRGARMATSPLPAPPPGPVSVQRRVARDGLIMITRHRLRVGSTHAGKTVTVLVEDTYFRILHNGEELCLHPRTSTEPITRFKVYAPRTTDRVSSMS